MIRLKFHTWRGFWLALDGSWGDETGSTGIGTDNLDPDQARQNVEPNLDPSCLKLCYSGNNSLKELKLKKISKDDKNMNKYLAS